jgi:hypothetical protein
MVCWNADGSTNSFTTNLLEHVSGDLYRGWIPAQALDARVRYYLQAETTNALVTLDPSNAPLQVHEFRVAEPIAFTVSGAPVEIGDVTPPYGTTLYASGLAVEAGANLYSTPSNGTRYALTGWQGDGSVAADGATNFTSFVLCTASTCTWQWAPEYSLSQTASLPDVLSTESWWRAGATAETVAAAASVHRDATNFMLAQWSVDGMRWPDQTNVAQNPAAGIVLYSPRRAEAVYEDEAVDSDTNGAGDWWEHFYFGEGSVVLDNDTDGDGAADGAEYTAGTHPRDAADVFSLTCLALKPGDTNLVLEWAAVTGRTYSIEWRTGLLDHAWLPLVTGVSAVATRNMAVTVVIDGATERFYRMRVSQD